MRALWPEPGTLDDEALIERHRIDRSRPSLRMNFVASLDGAGTLHGRSGGLSSPADQRLLDLLRMLADVLVVGAGTIRAEGYTDLRLDDQAVAWRRRHGLPAHPRLAIVSSRLDLLPDHPALAGAPVRALVITHASAPADRIEALRRTADVVVLGAAAVDVAALVGTLAGLGLPAVLCEGGPALFGELTAADQIDELCLALSPLVDGPGAGRITAGPVSQLHALLLCHVLAEDDMLFLRYARAS